MTNLIFMKYFFTFLMIVLFANSTQAQNNYNNLWQKVEQFEADDVVAGSAIGKMLSILFLYTVLAMSFVAWWTVTSISSQHGDQQQPTEQVAH